MLLGGCRPCPTYVVARSPCLASRNLRSAHRVGTRWGMAARSTAPGNFLLSSMIIIVSALAVTVVLHMLIGGQADGLRAFAIWWIPALGGAASITVLGWNLLKQSGATRQDADTRLRALLDAAP